MAVITELPDGSNGGDPNKNPQEEEEKQNENENQNETLQEVKKNLLVLPDDVIEYMVAICRRYLYPKLSLISRFFGHLITSEELFQLRSHLGFTEPVLYALIASPPYKPPSWFILRRRNTPLGLSRLTSLRSMYPGSVSVTLGHKIYVMGGCDRLVQPVTDVFVINCRIHTCENLPPMHRARSSAAAGVIEGKIYVIGGCEKRDNDWVEVFDVTTEVWEIVPSLCPNEAKSRGRFGGQHVVMEHKIHILDYPYCFTYEPRQGTWETLGPGSQQTCYWHKSSCVIDGLLYALVAHSNLGAPLLVYEPRAMVWKLVKGLHELPKLIYVESQMANLGGKLVILGCYESLYNAAYDWGQGMDVWCIELTLERGQDGDIWGQVVSVSRVHTFHTMPLIYHSRTVTV